MQNNFTDFAALNSYIQHKVKGSLVVTYRNCEDYEGMVLVIMIVFDFHQSKFDMDLQWMSLGLDLYGDTLQESYVYRFENLDELQAYLLLKYNIKVTDIPLKFQFDPGQFPDPIKDEAKKQVFETAWQRFRIDFKNNAFLDTSLQLVFDSNDH